MEDTNVYRKAQEEAAAALRDLKQREAAEREALLETLRARSIEAAFQQDAELALQRAAEEMVARQQLLQQSMAQPSPAPNLSPKVAELENETLQLQQKIRLLEGQLTDERMHSAQQESRWARQTQKMLDQAQAQVEKDHTDYEVIELRRRLNEEAQCRADLETEVQLLLSSRATLARELDAAATVRASQQLVEIKEELADARIQLSVAQDSLQTVSLELDDATEELNVLRRNGRELGALRLENHQLKTALVELRKARKAGGMSGSTGGSQGVSSTEDPVGIGAEQWGRIRGALLGCVGTAREAVDAEGETVRGLVTVCRERERVSDLLLALLNAFFLWFSDLASDVQCV